MFQFLVQYGRMGVRMGNWAEDRAADERVRSGAVKRLPFDSCSETQLQFMHPSERPARSAGPVISSGPPPAELPPHLLFAHGRNTHNPDEGHEERYATMMDLTT